MKRRTLAALNITKFVVPMSADDGGYAALESLLSGLDTGGDANIDLTDDDDNDDDNNDDDDAGGTDDDLGDLDDNDDDDDDEGDEDDDDDEGDKPPKPTKPTKQQKEAYAWDKKNHEVAQLTGVLSKIAKANGIEFKNKADLLSKLNQATTVKLAKKSGVTPELYNEIEQLRGQNEQFQAYQDQTRIQNGFQELITSYGLDQKGLTKFAQELDSKGLNPFINRDVDIVNQYERLHMKDIIDARVQEGLKAAMQIDAKGGKNGATVTKNRKPSGGGKESITTVEGLDSLLKSLNI